MPIFDLPPGGACIVLARLEYAGFVVIVVDTEDGGGSVDDAALGNGALLAWDGVTGGEELSMMIGGGDVTAECTAMSLRGCGCLVEVLGLGLSESSIYCAEVYVLDFFLGGGA